MTRVVVEPLDVAIHDRAPFACGAVTVDRYLHTVARQAAERFVARTYVLVPRLPREVPCEVLGFYTLVQHVYRDSDLSAEQAKSLGVGSLASVPVVLIAQLGIAQPHQGRGVGTRLLRSALRRSLLVGLSAGGVAVVTDPIDEAADRFYRSNAFVDFPPGPRLGISMELVARRNVDVVEAFHRNASEISFAPPERNIRPVSRVMRA